MINYLRNFFMKMKKWIIYLLDNFIINKLVIEDLDIRVNFEKVDINLFIFILENYRYCFLFIHNLD